MGSLTYQIIASLIFFNERLITLKNLLNLKCTCNLLSFLFIYFKYLFFYIFSIINIIII